MPPEKRRFLAESLLEPIRRYRQFLLISDDLELVLELDADGLHCSRRIYELASLRKRLGNKWLSQGASLDQKGQLTGKEKAQNKFLTARLISPVWQQRKQRTPLGPQAFADFAASLPKEQPFIYALGGATPALVSAAQAEHPQMTWRAAAIGSAHHQGHQQQWVDWLKESA